MKRDLEFIWKILPAVEGSQSFYVDNPFKIEGCTDVQIAHNSYLLIDADLVHGHSVTESNSRFPLTGIEYLN
jgi:hypothetical protein